MPKQSNPYLVALVVIAAVAGFVAGILVMGSGAMSTDLPSAAILQHWAGVFAQLGIAAVFCALVAAAISWRPKPVEETTAATPRVLETDGLTEAEKRFFSES